MTRRRARAQPVERELKTFHGVPFDQINEASKLYEEVYLIINRRGPLGRFAGVGSLPMKVSALADIQTWLQDKAGGGTYLLRPMRMDNHAEIAAPLMAFQLTLEGHPKPVTAREHGIPDVHAGISATLPAFEAALSMNAPNPMFPGALPPLRPLTPEEYQRLPEFVRPLPLEQQRSFLAQQAPQVLQPGYGQPVIMPQLAKHTSDEIAMSTVAAVREEMTALKQEYTRAAARHEKELAEARQETERARDREREAQAKMERETLQIQIEALKNAKAAPPTIDWGAVLGAVGTFVPVIKAMIDANALRANAMGEQQAKYMEMLARRDPPQDSTKQLLEGVMKILPAVMPVMSEIVKAKSPEAQANMWTTMLENQMTMAQMVGDITQNLVRQSGGSQEPYWMPVIQQLVGAAQNGFRSLVEAQRKANPMLPPQAPAASAPTTTAAEPQRTRGELVAQIILNNPAFPQELRTQDWYELIAMLHDHVEPQVVAGRATEMLIELENAGKIPAAIVADYERDPRQALKSFLGQLPVGQQNPQYIDVVIDKIIEGLSAAENAEDEDGDDDAEGGDTASNGAEPVPMPFDLTQRQQPVRMG